MTFLFSDVQGSTQLWEEHADAMRRALAVHDRILRSAITAHGGYIFSTAGDAFSAAFWTPRDAVGAAADVQRRLAAERWPTPVPLRVRIGLHTGTADERDGDYFGPAVNRAARIMTAAHGGQTVVSDAVRDLLDDVGVDLRDLGRHRLKDLLAPERIWQLGVEGLADEFAPLRTLDVRKHNLPVQHSSFVGRASEIALLRDELAVPSLVTLVGPGGVGKTRLAVHTAAELLDSFEHGVWLVELGVLEDGSLVPGALLDALAISRQRRPDEVVLMEHLAGRNLLIVLDNCEHLLDHVAGLVQRLLAYTPDLTVLATSREPLGLDGERVIQVGSLTAATAGTPGVQLFYERAEAAGIRLTDSSEVWSRIFEIAERLDGLPLAIELAAARLRVMNLDDLASHLSHRFRLLVSTRRDIPTRHRSLEATIGWSYDQLDTAQQRLFDCAGVFSGGFCAPDAALLLDSDELTMLDDLSQLVDKSLLTRLEGEAGRTRYRMLETMRQLGEEHLVQSGQLSAVRVRFLAWAQTLVRDAEPHLPQGDQQWLARLDLDMANIRTALVLATEHPALAPAGLEIAGRLNRYWFLRTLYGEGRDWVERLLEAAPGAAAGDRARALQTVGFLLGEAGDDRAAAVAALDRSVALYRELGDRRGLGAALNLRGRVNFENATPAHADLLESTLIAREVQDTGTLFLDLLMTITWHLAYGDPMDAVALTDEALEIARRLAAPQALAHALEAKAYLALMGVQSIDDATTYMREALTHHRRVGNAGCACHALETSAWLLAVRQRGEPAEQLYATARFVRQRLHAPVSPYEMWLGARLAGELPPEPRASPLVTDASGFDIGVALDRADEFLAGLPAGEN